MSSVQLGQKVPDFRLPASNGKDVALSDFHGKYVVLFFYPKDMTPTCTTEACDFRDFTEQFERYDAVVLGISPDPVQSHAKFIEKHRLPYLLLADEGRSVCELFGVWKLKKMYGREYMGVERSTFLIDREGRLVREWRKVRVKGHVNAVLEALKELQS